MVRYRRTRNTRSKYTRKRNRRTNNRRMRNKKQNKRTRRKQHGGFNKNSKGSKTYFTMDSRYRLLGDLKDTISFQGKKLFNNMSGNYKAINPNVSKQPIGAPLSVKNLKFGVGTTSETQQLFNEANLRASAFPNKN